MTTSRWNPTLEAAIGRWSAWAKEGDYPAILKDYMESHGASGIQLDENVAKISIVGAGMESHAGVATKMFEALYDAQINIQMISTSEIKVSVLIDAVDADKAVKAIHAKFFD